MTALREELVYRAGPYQGYYGRAEYDRQAKRFHGQVTGTRDAITFQAKRQEDLGRAFRESVDDYLAFCRQRQEEPKKPFSGKFMTRISPELHRKLSALADLAGKSLNQFVSESLEAATQANDRSAGESARGTRTTKSFGSKRPKAPRKRA